MASIKDEGDKKYRFSVSCGETGKVFELSAEDHKSKQQWMTAVEKVCADQGVGVIVCGVCADQGVGVIVCGVCADQGVGVIVCGVCADQGVGVIVCGVCADQGVG